MGKGSSKDHQREPLELSKEEADKWEAYKDGLQDLMAGIKDPEAAQGALNAIGQISKNLDSESFLNSLQVPADAGEYREALKRILLRIPEGWGRWISLDKGWYPIVIELDKTLAELDPEYQVQQVKEKYGTLRYYYSLKGGSQVQELARRAEEAAYEKAASTCETCGEPGVLRMSLSPSPWYKTLCEACGLEKGYVTQELWESWWAEEEPKFKARRKAYWVKSQAGKRLLVLSAKPEKRLAVAATYITDPQEASHAANKNWDGIWISGDAVGEAFVKALVSNNPEHARRLETDYENWRLGKSGRGSFGWDRLPGLPTFYNYQDAKNLQDDLLHKLGVTVQWTQELHFEETE